MKVFPSIGIKDIVCLSLCGDNLKLAYARVSPTRKEIVDLVSFQIQGLSDEEITKSIRSSLESLKLASPEIVVIVPSHATIAKNIEIPSLDQQEIKEIVDLQAGRHTPYAREEIIIDYISIGAHKENYTKILLIIVTLSVVRRQIDILERAGLRVEKVYFAPESVTHFVQKAAKPSQEAEVQTLLHIDAHFTDFINILNGEIIFVRSIPIGRQHLANEAERYRVRFVDEVRKSLETFQSEDIGPLPQQICLSGAVTDEDGFARLLSETLMMPVEVFPYLKHTPISSEELKRSLAVSQDSFLDVIAPVLNINKVRLNLIPEEIKLRQKFEEKSRDLVTSGFYIMTILALLCFMLISRIFFMVTYLNTLQKRYDPVIESSKLLEKNFSQMRIIKGEIKDRYAALDVLSVLYSLVPTDIKLTNIKFSVSGKFSLEGNSRTMGTVFSFIGDMEDSAFFKSVESRRTTKRREGDQEVVDFQIDCVLERMEGKTE